MADALFERELDRAGFPESERLTRHLYVPATDGFPLGATLVRSGEKARGAIVLAPATGVRRRYYEPFQRWLGAQGFDVLSFDYRGIGGSRPASLAGFDARMSDWGAKDLAGILDWVSRELEPSSLLLDAILCVGSQSGDYRLWPAPARYRMALYWYALLPTVTATWGYLPSGLAGEELPRGVALEWAKWCRTDGYLLGGDRGALRDGFRRVRAPLLALGFDDDPYAPPAAVAGLLDLYAEASREHRQIDPRAEGFGPVGHFGFFRERFRKTLWAEARDWLTARAAGLPRAPNAREKSASLARSK
jgi:predicted alpha/beta hydrolase